jgi:hypothetical protein
MGSTTEPIGREATALSDLERKSILHELDAILNSPFFLPSKRCQQFLTYVVHHELEGNHERLKERTIGVDLFHRHVGYATGDDPVVRVQAGVVRRRLEQYYQAALGASRVRIQLHPGSYIPDFVWTQSASPLQQPPPPLQALPEFKEALQQAEHGLPSSEVALPPIAATQRASVKRNRFVLTFAVVGIAVLAALALIGSTIYRARTPQAALKSFWAPALSSSEPILICLAKPSVYRPSVALYQRHSKTPEVFLDQFERLSRKPDLQPDDKLEWSDMVEYPDYGLAVGDVYTAIRLSELLGKVGKKNQVRIGGHYSFEDLRSSPAVVIGAFNNRWSMQMTSDLHFAFSEEGDQPIIREKGPSGRKWYSRTDANGNASEDYAAVTRLLNSKTGQFVVVVAGIKSYGTQAAGEFVSTPQYLQNALRSAPHDWEIKNLQIILETTVTDGLPGPPQVVALYVW